MKKTGIALAFTAAVALTGCATQSDTGYPNGACPTPCPTYTAKDAVACKAMRHHKKMMRTSSNQQQSQQQDQEQAS